jgi:tetratricopeptide (TPR) repeat protein
MHPNPILRMPRSAWRALVAVALAASAAGCASASKRYEQGVQLEQQGRAADAAQRYVDALKKDRTLADARTRLLDAGQRAIADYLRDADAAEGAGRYDQAAETLRRLDALRDDAGSVGVALPAPAGYEQRRATTFERAIDQALAEAEGALQRRDYAAAVRTLDRVGERWHPTPGQLARLERTRQDAQLAWAEGEMSAGRYRSAFEHARQAGGGMAAGRSAEIQEEALRRGTVRVAVFPVGAPSRMDDRVRASVLPELNDALALGPWARAPQWIDVLNPVAASRLARQRGWWGRDIQPYEAASMGRELGAQVAVAMTLDSIRRTEAGVETVRRTAKTRAGVDTAYTIREGRLETWARVAWRLVDVDGYRGTGEQGNVNARSSTRFRHATYAGDWRDLELPQAERMLFQRRDEGYNRETVRELANGLTDSLGRAVFDALLRRIN